MLVVNDLKPFFAELKCMLIGSMTVFRGRNTDEHNADGTFSDHEFTAQYRIPAKIIENTLILSLNHNTNPNPIHTPTVTLTYNRKFLTRQIGSPTSFLNPKPNPNSNQPQP